MSQHVARDSAVDVERLISALQERIATTLRPLLGEYRRCALIDFPDHQNVGDSAIWAGEQAWLTELGMDVVYRCDVQSYRRHHLATALGDGIILIHGGGNLGDLWQRHQRLRETVIRDFPSTRIIQLSQTIHFRHGESIEKARALFDRHRDLTILVRDDASLHLARRYFQASSLLCPDSAFSLGPIRRPQAADLDLLWLGRTDLEAAALPPVTLDDRMVRCDWIDRSRPVLQRLRHTLTPLVVRRLGHTRVLQSMLGSMYDAQARQQVHAGCRLLSRGGVVVTDRLHAHVLCLLMGIRHVLLDNNYGKVRGFYETWTRGSSLVTWAESPQQAVTAARELLGQPERRAQ